MGKRSLGSLVLAVIATAALAVSALASNVSHPAIYTGAAATGGTIELEVSPDGTEVTSFAFKGVPMPPCGTFTAYTVGPVADIVADAFSERRGRLYIDGTFPAIQQAQGTMTYHRVDGVNCASQEVSWTATTPTPPPDEAPPDTRIVSAPKGVAMQRRATFRFASTEPGSTFQCKRDGGVWSNCTSPKAYRRLPSGPHVFKVRATDAAGNVDLTPAQRRWRIEIS
jgi:hypothetical protein